MWALPVEASPGLAPPIPAAIPAGGRGRASAFDPCSPSPIAIERLGELLDNVSAFVPLISGLIFDLDIVQSV